MCGKISKDVGSKCQKVVFMTGFSQKLYTFLHLGKGKIVKKGWFDECHKRRRRTNTKRYFLGSIMILFSLGLNQRKTNAEDIWNAIWLHYIWHMKSSLDLEAFKFHPNLNGLYGLALTTVTYRKSFSKHKLETKQNFFHIDSQII